MLCFFFFRFSSAARISRLYVYFFNEIFECSCFLACLLSALMAQNISWSPYLIRLALENTARLPKDQNRFAVGSGLLQVAFTFLKTCSVSGLDLILSYVSDCCGMIQKSAVLGIG